MRELKTKGVLGEKTFKLLRRIPIEVVEIDEWNRVVLRLLGHVNKEDAKTLLVAIEENLKKDRLDEKSEIERLEATYHYCLEEAKNMKLIELVLLCPSCEKPKACTTWRKYPEIAFPKS